jgi:probable HAF family extracellular repeat protein
MKSRFRMLLAAITFFAGLALLFAALALPLRLAAQDKQNPNRRHHHYKLIDLGTFGGPNSSVATGFFETAGSQSISDQGAVTGTADTSIPDPLCYFDDCFYPNAFQWRDGTLTDLGALPGTLYSAANWISRNGRLIAGQSENGQTDPVTGFPAEDGVLWQDAQITDLGTLSGGYESDAFAVNNHGQVTGGSTNGTADPYSIYYFGIFGISTGGQTRAFVWDKHNGLQDLGTLGGPDALATLINERGQIAGVSYTSSTPNPNNGPCTPNVPTQDPFLWEKGAGGMTDIGTFGGTCGQPDALNNRDQVVGLSYLAGNLTYHPFLWDKRSHPPLSDLGTFGGDNGVANWINDSGEVAGSADFPGNQIHHAFLWKNGVMTDLGTVGTDPCSRASAINSKGQIVGGSSDCTTFLHAYLWENGGPMIDLNTLVAPGSGLTLTLALYINDRGEIAGNGVLANGDTHAFVLIPCGEGDEGCEGENPTGVTQSSPTSVAQRPAAATPANQTLSGRGMMDRLRSRWGQRYQLPGRAFGPKD